MKHQFATGILLTVLALTIGCAEEKIEQTNSETSPSVPAIDGSQFLLAEEPASAATVIEARESATDGADVVLVGRIGGSFDPWVDGRAMFSIVDPSLRACSDIPGDNCEYPWDYCCETHKLPTSMATVKFVDEDGKVLKADARKLLNLKELQTVVIQGTAKRDEAGNLTVLASGLFVRDSGTGNSTSTPSSSE